MAAAPKGRAQPSNKAEAPTWLQAVRALIFVCCFNATFILINVNQWLGAPLYWLNRQAFWAWIARSKQDFAVQVVGVCQWFAPTEVVFSADASCADEIAVGEDGLLTNTFAPRAIVISNHQIYADWLYIWWAAYASRMHGALYIILKDSLKWIPVVGWGMQFFGFIFMSRRWETDRARLEHRLKQLERETDWPMWLLLYPEGTNLSANTRPRAQAYADKIGAPKLEHVLLPRSTGMRYCVANLRKSVDFIYDCTVAYEPSARGAVAAEQYTLRSIFFQSRPPKRVHMHWRKIPIAGVPCDDEKAFEQWLYDRWVEKEYMLEQYHAQGGFECTQSYTAPLRLHSQLEVFNRFTPLVTIGLLVKIASQLSSIFGRR